MNVDLDEQQLMLRDLVARFAADCHGPGVGDRAAASAVAVNRWALFAELGLAALPFAVDQGGLNGGTTEIITVAEQLGRGLCPIPWLGDLILAGRLLDRAGTATQRAAWLPGMIAGERRLALAHAEHRARYNDNFVSTKAEHGLLDGAKTMVFAGDAADAFIVSARERGERDDMEGIALWLVAADAPGLTRRDYHLMDGSVASEVTLRRAPGERLTGGGAELRTVFDDARVAIAAEMIGIMGALFDATLEHVRTRRQFGQPLGAFQVIQHRMADLYVACEQARSQLLRAALSTETGNARSATIAGAKSFVAMNAMRLGEECIQLHGGMGVTDELAVGRGHKRILLLASLLGDADAELSRYVRLVA